MIEELISSSSDQDRFQFLFGLSTDHLIYMEKLSFYFSNFQNILKTLVEQVKAQYYFFRLRGYKQIYDMIFVPSQFPIFFAFQALWSCLVVMRSNQRKEKGPFFFVATFLQSAIITFLPREILALFLKKPSPLQHYSYQIVAIFVAAYIISALILLISSKISFFFNFALYFAGLVQGANQARLFTLILRNHSHFKSIEYTLGAALLFTVLDQVLEILLRQLMNGKETKASNLSTVTRSTVFLSLFWAATHRNRFSNLLGFYNFKKSALTLALALGVFNAIGALEDAYVPPPPPTPTPTTNTPEEENQ